MPLGVFGQRTDLHAHVGVDQIALAADLKTVVVLVDRHRGAGIWMAHWAKHIDTTVDIINICTQRIAHGNAVAGGTGTGKDMDGFLARVVIEHGLEFIHHFLVAGEGAGGHDHGLAADLHFAAFILRQHTADLSVGVGQQLFTGGLEQQFAAVFQKLCGHMLGHIGADLARANHAVNAFRGIVPGVPGLKDGHCRTGTHVALLDFVILEHIVLVDQPVGKLLVGLKHARQQFRIHPVLHLFQKFFVFCLAVVLDSQLCTLLAPMNAEAAGIPGGAAHFMHFFQRNDRAAQIQCLVGGDQTGTAAADHADVALLDQLFVGGSCGGGMLRVTDAAVMAYLDTFSAGNALFRIDPILCVFKTDGLHGAAGAAAVAGGT